MNRHQRIRVGLVGIGNCASALVQAVHYYQNQNASEEPAVPGLMDVNLGPYHVGQIEFSAAFDIHRAKVGLDLSEALWGGPSNSHRSCQVPSLGTTVRRGRSMDGLGKYLSEAILPARDEPSEVAGVLWETETEVLVSLLPVGSEETTAWYAEQALEAGCAFINGSPVLIASKSYWRYRFEERGLPLLGDDLKSQVGATMTHRVLTNSAGVVLDAIRCARLALDHQIGGALVGPSSYFMKAPPEEFTENEARLRTEAFIRNPSSTGAMTALPPAVLL